MGRSGIVTAITEDNTPPYDFSTGRDSQQFISRSGVNSLSGRLYSRTIAWGLIESDSVLGHHIDMFDCPVRFRVLPVSGPKRPETPLARVAFFVICDDKVVGL